MPWIAWCLASSLLGAIFLWVNGHYRLPSLPLIFGRSAISVLVLAPFAFGVEWPKEPAFYLWAAAAGFSGYYYDLLVYAGVARFGGASIARMLPLRIGIVFLLWCVLHQGYALHLFSVPWRGVGVVGALVVACAAVANLSRHEVSWAVFRHMLPATAALALSDIFSKFALNHAGHAGAALVLYPILVNLVIMPLILIRMAQRGETEQLGNLWRIPLWGKAAIVAGIAFAAQIAVKGQSLLLVPDPSYFVAINTLSAVWLTLWYRFRGLRDDTDPVAGFVFVAALVLLILCAPGV